MSSLAISAIGRDRPGIVAALASVLYDLGCNVEDSSMTLLRGNFAMMLVVAGPDDLRADDVRNALAPVCDDLGMLFSVSAVDDRVSVPHPTHILTVYGADKPGILFRTTQVLSDQGANITDLESRLVGDPPVYAVMLELEVPADAVARLDDALRATAEEIGVDVVLREHEADVL
ncbi:MAG: ACT domain-containing protein [Actinomycetota bacterium]